jgi:hypothetical protein
VSCVDGRGFPAIDRVFRGARDGTWRTWAFRLTGVGVLFVTMNAVRPIHGATVADLCFLAATLLAVPSLLAERPTFFRIPVWLAVAAGGLAVAVLISTLANAGLASNGADGLRFMIGLFLTPLLLGYVTASSERVGVFADLWVAGAAANSLVAGADFLKLTHVGRWVDGVDFERWTHRTAGLTIHPNHLGLVAAMAVPIAVSRTLTASGRRRLLYAAAVLVLGFGILASGSRTDLVAGLIGVVALPLLHPIARKPVLAAIVACALAVSVIAAVFAAPRNDLLIAVHRLSGSDPSSSQSDSARSALIHQAVTQFRDHPLTGAGFAGVRTAHDIYLQLLAAGGVLALPAFLLFTAGVLVLGLRLRRAAAFSPATQNLAAACTASMVVWLAGGVFGNEIYDRYLYLPAGLLLGLWFALDRERPAAAAPEEAAVPVPAIAGRAV